MAEYLLIIANVADLGKLNILVHFVGLEFVEVVTDLLKIAIVRTFSADD